MSSILKALKKIEESASPEPVPVQAVAVEPQSVFRTRLREKKSAARGLVYGAAAVGVLLAAVLVVRFLPETPPPAGAPPSPATPESAAGGVKEIRGKMPRAAGSPSPSSPMPPPVTRPGPAPGNSAGGADPAAARPPAPTPPGQRAEVSKPMRARSRDTATMPAKEERPFVVRKEAPAPPAEGPGAARAAPVKTAEDGFDRLDESKLKVMAIAWSQDPNRRIAVVNGRIIKEGESVDGYSVTRIRKDDILVSDGSKSWRVVFTLKTQP